MLWPEACSGRSHAGKGILFRVTNTWEVFTLQANELILPKPQYDVLSICHLQSLYGNSSWSLGHLGFETTGVLTVACLFLRTVHYSAGFKQDEHATNSSFWSLHAKRSLASSQIGTLMGDPS